MPRAAPKPLPPDEAALVRTLQDAVRDCTLSEPAAVRARVVRELAILQTTARDASRINRGELTSTERRVIRTVTNRGAAVRSRLRQRKELARLRAQLKEKDERVKVLEAALRTVNHPGVSNISSTSTFAFPRSSSAGKNSSAANAAPSSGKRERESANNNAESGLRSSFDGNAFGSFIDSLMTPIR